MATQRRWMRWIFTEAEAFDTVLPWERRADRALWRRHLSGVGRKLRLGS